MANEYHKRARINNRNLQTLNVMDKMTKAYRIHENVSSYMTKVFVRHRSCMHSKLLYSKVAET